MKKTSLQDHARPFAQDLSELLNSTVTDGISISATTIHREQVLLGREVGRNSLEPKPIPLSRNRNRANVYLMYTHWCVLDDDDTHLATLISTMNLHNSEEISNESLLHQRIVDSLARPSGAGLGPGTPRSAKAAGLSGYLAGGVGSEGRVAWYRHGCPTQHVERENGFGNLPFLKRGLPPSDLVNYFANGRN